MCGVPVWSARQTVCPMYFVPLALVGVTHQRGRAFFFLIVPSYTLPSRIYFLGLLLFATAHCTTTAVVWLPGRTRLAGTGIEADAVQTTENVVRGQNDATAINGPLGINCEDTSASASGIGHERGRWLCCLRHHRARGENLSIDLSCLVC